MLRAPRIGLLTDSEADAFALELILQKHAVVTHIPCFDKLLIACTRNKLDAVFCDWNYGEGWQNALRSIQRSHPNLPVIILSRNGGEREWIEALDAGAFDLLVPPHSAKSLLAVVVQAGESRNRKMKLDSPVAYMDAV